MSASLGLVIYSAVKPIFKIYFIIGMGFFLAKRNILPVTTCRDISDLVVSAVMPCLIFTNIVSYLQSSDIKALGIIFFEGTLLFVVGALLGLLTHYVCKSPKAWFGGLISVGLFPNISDLPIAYLQTMARTGSLFTSAESDKGVAYVCIFLASQVFYQFSLGLFKLIRYDFRDQLAESDAEGTVGASDSGEKKAEKEPVSAEKPEDVLAPRSSDSSASIASSELEAKSLAEDTPETPQNKLLAPSGSRLCHTSSSVSRRRGSSSLVIENPLHMTSSRNTDACSVVSEHMEELIHEYSEFQNLRTNETHRSQSIMDDDSAETTSQVSEHAPTSSKFKRRVISTLKNFLAPNSVSLIVSLIIAMSPPLKALFVESKFHLPSAPDHQPPLSFVIDITSYVGAASVPLGLLILGATISRLKVHSMIPGFWKTAVMITACRLIILPIFGVGLTTGLQNAGWYGDDRLIRFVSVLEFGLPNATALVYFTAFYTDPDSPDHLQMDCLAICLIAQYAILFISLPFLVTFSLKVSMGF
ncbi:hypothetical protein OY671_005027 [Metschnikowia pulcherrima]|nr:hypothetical protein OY671_005027 [Metschnikowia pulcherrima]